MCFFADSHITSTSQSHKFKNFMTRHSTKNLFVRPCVALFFYLWLRVEVGWSVNLFVFTNSVYLYINWYCDNGTRVFLLFFILSLLMHISLLIRYVKWSLWELGLNYTVSFYFLFNKCGLRRLFGVHVADMDFIIASFLRDGWKKLTHIFSTSFLWSNFLLNVIRVSVCVCVWKNTHA